VGPEPRAIRGIRRHMGTNKEAAPRALYRPGLYAPSVLPGALPGALRLRAATREGSPCCRYARRVRRW
jgi:hypothetical protein